MANFIFHYPTRAADPTGAAGASIAGLESYPSDRPVEKPQSRGFTGGNAPLSEDLGAAIFWLELKIENLSGANKTALFTFINTTANWSASSFDITDHNGVEYDTCYIWQDTVSFPKQELPEDRHSEAMLILVTG